MSNSEVEATEVVAEQIDEQVDTGPKAAAFFHVDIEKFAILFVMTVGMYQLYWFYKQWSALKKYYQLDAWPIPRAFFSIFFTHSLCTYVNEYFREDGREYKWSNTLNATIYVGLILVGAILGQVQEHFSDLVLIGVASLLLTLASGIPLLQIQKAINVALIGSEYEVNDDFTWLNWIWFVLGIIYWFFVCFGLYATYAGLV